MMIPARQCPPPAPERCDPRRRTLLKLSGLLGLSTAASALLPLERAEALWFSRDRYKVSSTRLAMGTFVTLTAIHPSKDQAEEAFGRAFAEIDRLAALLSRHRTDSPVAELNRSSRLDDPPPELTRVIRAALHVHRETGGGFDITVKPLIDCYEQCFATGRAPSDDMIDALLPAVGGAYLREEPGRISFARPGMGITLDGIAKGYIVDKVSELLGANGIADHLVNAGGDIRAAGLAAGGRRWTVAVQDPDKQGRYPEVFTIGDGAVATSGNYEIYYDREKLFHHIVDGRSGRSPQTSTSVTVTAPTAMEADALSTALFVLGPGPGVALIDGRADSDCLLLGRGGEVSMSRRWGG